MKSPISRDIATTAIGLAVLTLVSFSDYFVPPDIQLLVFYLVPLAVLSMRVPMRYCALAAVWAGTGWWLANWLSAGGEPLDGIRVWNTLSRTIIFFSFVSLVHYFRAQLEEKERAMDGLRNAKKESNPVMGLRRMCDSCLKVQTDKDDWIPLESWLSRDCQVTWADSTCPRCHRGE